jgi:primosomal protein N' (replication factor Y)
MVGETRQRRLLGHPPFSSLVLIRVEGADRDRAQRAARELARKLRSATPRRGPVRIQGPVSAPLTRLVGRWRYQLVVRGQDRPALRRWLREVDEHLDKTPGKGVRLTVDVDPRSLL